MSSADVLPLEALKADDVWEEDAIPDGEEDVAPPRPHDRDPRSVPLRKGDLLFVGQSGLLTVLRLAWSRSL